MVRWWAWCVVAVVALSPQSRGFAQDDQTDAAAKPQAAGAWTLDEALAHLRLFPRDAYVQYVALQLARSEGRLDEVVGFIGSRNPRRDQFNQRQGQVNLFSIFSGSLAVQESLQLDAMAPVDVSNQVVAEQPGLPGENRTGPRPLDRQPATAPAGAVAMSELEGPTIKSHPWHEMLAGKTPEVTGLALVAPAEFYFVSFRSVNKLLDAADLTNLWGAHLLNQTAKNAQTQLVNDRLREQLAVETNPAAAPFYNAVIDEAAIVGSDLFVPSGSDVTLLFHAKQPAVMRATFDQFLARAAASRDDAVRSTGQYLGVDWVHVATPDRRINVFSAYPSPELHVRSNSQAALERVLEAIAGRDAGGQKLARLGETEEFRYVRTLMPQGAVEEDGFVYLSDPFVRRLMGPQVRLTQHRRMACYNHLRMIGHAGLLYRTQTGKTAASLGDLAKADCAPGLFGQGRLACPDHGEYTLAADGLTGVCSHHGYASYLTPCLEIPTTEVSESEAQAYRQFLAEYNSYWRQFFDPIAIRLQVTPERYRAETIVLPLIDNSIYQGLARSLGGEPEPLDELPVPRRNIFSFAVRLNKAELLREMGLSLTEDLVAENQATEHAANSLRQIALAMHNYHGARGSFPSAATRDDADRPLLSWRVHLLPYLEQNDLYRKFHLDEPWDSEHNRVLIAEIPAVLRPEDETLAKAGKTKFLAPRGEGTIFPPTGKGVGLRDITDGSSMTAMIVEGDDLHATVWTRPDDVEIDLDKPARDLEIREPGAFLLAMCDGSVHFLRRESADAQIAGLMTRSGEEPIQWNELQHEPMPNSYRSGPFGADDEMLRDLHVGEMLTKGIGNQVAFHAYDADPLFDLSLAQIVGTGVSRMRGGNGGIDDDFFFIIPLIGALNSPVYVSIPVEDPAIVDDFLNRLDKWLVQLANQEPEGWFFTVDQDFYHLRLAGDRHVRGYGFSFGPLKWRFYWSRLGNGLYVASRREVIEDLAAIASPEANAAAAAARQLGSRARRIPPRVGREQPRSLPPQHGTAHQHEPSPGQRRRRVGHGRAARCVCGAAVRRAPLLPGRRHVSRCRRRPVGVVLDPQYGGRAAPGRIARRGERLGPLDAELA
jgi:hypothetical protein